MKTCPDYKQRSRPGEYICGARGGKCTRKDDETVTCRLRDLQAGTENNQDKAGSRARG